MYIDISQSGNYRRVLLRESYRENKRVKKRTLANLSHYPDSVVLALQIALRNVDKIPLLLANDKENSTPLQHGKSVGAVFAAVAVARKVGLVAALGRGRQAQLALWQIIARLIDQGSRLSAVRLHETHALAEAVGLQKGFCEDDLYQNLAWLTKQQDKIEDRLFKFKAKRKLAKQTISLFLYDVTSSYLEGKHNELAAYGYNRDGKKSKLQIVIGLLCDQTGEPVSVQVFSGNTSDVTTFGDQIKKAAQRFGCQRVTFVGDRGMIKSTQKENLADADFNYITALTRKQIETLEKNEVIQQGMFDEELCEVEKDSVRYILRRNPYRAADIAETRLSKETSVAKLLRQKNEYLQAHPRAAVDAALREINKKIEKLKCGWLSVSVGESENENEANEGAASESAAKENTARESAASEASRWIYLRRDEAVLGELSRLDGCYVMTTDLSREDICAKDVHAYYKDLSKVERAFRESKTGHLELRPIHVRKEASTRGHVFVVMLAYLLRRELERAWDEIDVTMEEGLDCLATLSSVVVGESGGLRIERVPAAGGLCGELLAGLDYALPQTVVRRGLDVSTRVKARKRP